MQMARAAAPQLLRRSTRIQAKSSSDASAPADQPGPTNTKSKRPNKRSKVDHDVVIEGASEPAVKATKSAAAGGPTRDLEKYYWSKNYKHVIGVDEAGRGPLAGPVVAGACIIPPHVKIDGIDDSKKLNGDQRDEIFEQLTNHPEVIWSAHIIDVMTIDEINILQATMKAMAGAVAGIKESKDAAILVDGNRLPVEFDVQHSKAVIKGDAKSICIAAASVIAKVIRDRIMDELHAQWPMYGFGQHKGYGVAAHVAAIKKHGPCEAHRRTFAPVKNWFPLETEDADKA